MPAGDQQPDDADAKRAGRGRGALRRPAVRGGASARPNAYLGARGAGGWGWQSLSTRQMTRTGNPSAADLGRGVLFQIEPALAPAAPTRGGRAFANLYLRGAGPGLVPLISAEPPSRDPGISAPNRFRVRYAGANAGTAATGPFTHVLLEANDALPRRHRGPRRRSPKRATNARSRPATSTSGRAAPCGWSTCCRAAKRRGRRRSARGGCCERGRCQIRSPQRLRRDLRGRRRGSSGAQKKPARSTSG